jgi:hypothetical protein
MTVCLFKSAMAYLKKRTKVPNIARCMIHVKHYEGEW